MVPQCYVDFEILRVEEGLRVSLNMCAHAREEGSGQAPTHLGRPKFDTETLQTS